MKVAIITAYHDSDAAYLPTCLTSVQKQRWPVTHFLVADGCALPSQLTSLTDDIRCITLDKRYNDSGNTPRAAGTAAAINEGFDAVAYLDADNWYHFNHIASLVDLHNLTGALVCASQRMICSLDGRPLGVCMESGTERFTDTSGFALFHDAITIGLQWTNSPDHYHRIGDRILWRQIHINGMTRAFSELTTVGYRARHVKFYTRCGNEPPNGSRKRTGIKEAVKHYYLEHGIDLSIKWRIKLWNSLSVAKQNDWIEGTIHCK